MHAHRSKPFSVAAVVDWVFFVFGAVFSAWFAVLLIRSGLNLNWWHLLYLVGFWVVAAYLALPRLHRVLTELYVPDYFIGRVRTPDGLLGDPVNLALRGTGEQVAAAFEKAGWAVADPITFQSSRRIITSSLTGRSYPEAPVSSLNLFGRAQDVAFQQEVADSPSKRHHVRLWRCPEGWFLPGGHQVDWLAAGTYDRAVGLSLFTWQVTHKIDADTDAERDYIVETLRHADSDVDVEVIKDFSTGYHHRNGGGDLIDTDGDLPVIDVTRVQGTSDQPWVAATRNDTESSDAPPRPAIFILAVAAIITGVFLQLAQVIHHGVPDIPETADLDFRLLTASLAAMVSLVVYVPLMVFFLRGHSWARYGMLAVLASNGVATMLTPMNSIISEGALGILNIATWIVALVALSDRAASDWVRAIKVQRRREKASGGSSWRREAIGD
ncbi:hypothetical protein CATRI_08140 [Corynebacterium atrinae]|nr:hypothetical protein CATRI_08140 [Corynebacterium atrinae]